MGIISHPQMFVRYVQSGAVTVLALQYALVAVLDTWLSNLAQFQRVPQVKPLKLISQLRV